MLIAGTDARVIAGVALGIGALAIYLTKSGVVRDVAQSVNPLNNNNVFYRGVNGVGEVVTGEKDFSLGAWAWEVLNPAKVAAERGVTVQNLNPARSGGTVEPWQDPRSA